VCTIFPSLKSAPGGKLLSIHAERTLFSFKEYIKLDKGPLFGLGQYKPHACTYYVCIFFVIGQETSSYFVEFIKLNLSIYVVPNQAGKFLHKMNLQLCNNMKSSR